MQTAFRINGNEITDLNGPPRRTQRRQSRPRRSSSVPRIEIRSPWRDPSIDSATLRRKLISETQPVASIAIHPGRDRRIATPSVPFRRGTPLSPSSPSFRWFPVRSSSDPSSIPRIIGHSLDPRNNLPLKPCMKHKSKSTAPAPLSGHVLDLGEGTSLRRVKTVDFDETVSRKLLSLPPLKVWAGDAARRPSPAGYRAKAKKGNDNDLLRRVPHRLSSYPAPSTKGKPADTAITRTDVHVVAVAPSWSVEDLAVERSIDPATPTMQIVESTTGCYEVIWDDLPPDDEMHAHRRSSSATLFLSTGGLKTPSSLERVNSKLAQWTWGDESRASSFKPQTVVFPDCDGRTPHFNCTIEDDEDLVVIAPPNTARSSADASRYPSAAASARDSMADSPEDSTLTEDDGTDAHSHNKKHSFIVLGTEIKPTHVGSRIGASPGARKPSINRRLSNLDNSELKFREHRDSVTLARSRIFNVGGVSPEHFMHRDSIAMAKKRMHARNHAVSHARDIPRAQFVASESLVPIDDATDVSASSLKIQSALKGLKGSASTSMLAPQPASGHRHIRILE